MLKNMSLSGLNKILVVMAFCAVGGCNASSSAQNSQQVLSTNEPHSRRISRCFVELIFRKNQQSIDEQSRELINSIMSLDRSQILYVVANPSVGEDLEIGNNRFNAIKDYLVERGWEASKIRHVASPRQITVAPSVLVGFCDSLTSIQSSYPQIELVEFIKESVRLRIPLSILPDFYRIDTPAEPTFLLPDYIKLTVKELSLMTGNKIGGCGSLNEDFCNQVVTISIYSSREVNAGSRRFYSADALNRAATGEAGSMITTNFGKLSLGYLYTSYRHGYNAPSQCFIEDNNHVYDVPTARFSEETTCVVADVPLSGSINIDIAVKVRSAVSLSEIAENVYSLTQSFLSNN